MTWVTVKGEAAFLTSPDRSSSDEYALYVVQLERQAGQWFFDGRVRRSECDGASVDADVRSRPGMSEADSWAARATRWTRPERGLIEGAVRQNGDGYYG